MIEALTEKIRVDPNDEMLVRASGALPDGLQTDTTHRYIKEGPVISSIRRTPSRLSTSRGHANCCKRRLVWSARDG